MRLFRLPAVCAAVFGLALAAVPVLAQAPAPTPHIDARASWDNQFIYFAFLIDDTDLLGTHIKPMSEANEDDSIGVYFRNGTGPAAATPDPATHAMIVSAAGGFTFLVGAPSDKAFKPQPTFTVKYAVTLQGTLNRSDDRDKGYTVTMAVPIAALGIDPKTLKPGMELPFVAVARRRPSGEDKGGLTATTEGVKTEADVNALPKWGKIVLAGPDGKTAGPPAPGTVVALRIPEKGKPPLIDGVYRPVAWPEASKFVFASPDIPKAEIKVVPVAIPGAEADRIAPTLNLTKPLVGMERRLFARYLIGYQADPRKAGSPVRGMFLADGTLAFADQPAAGIGPWFSNDRTSWHKTQFADMRQAGVDAALVQVVGPETEIGTLEEKALLVMVSALREMALEGTPAPRVAPCIETAALLPRDSAAPDMATEAGRATLYRAIRRWFHLVPPEFREKVHLPPDVAGRPVTAYPVYLSNPTTLANVTNGEWIDDLRKRFAAEFGAETGGATLLICGGDTFPAVPGMAAVTPLVGGGKGSGPIPTAVVQPGSGGLNAPVVTRKSGETYRESWTAALKAKPAWIVIDSWNDYIRATEVAPSRQYGERYRDLTRVLAAQAAVGTGKNVLWLDNDVPRRIRPEQVITATITLKNAGSEILRGEDGIALTYRWRDKSGQVVAQGPIRLRLGEAIPPTRTVTLPLGVVAARLSDDGKLEALTPGEYTLEIGMTASSPLTKAVYFGDDPSSGVNPPLRLPVTVTPDLPEAVEFAGTTTPALMVGGGTYPVRVRLRWMGKDPLTPDKAQLIYQVLTEDGSQTVLTGTAPLPEALRPGMWQTVSAQVQMGDAGGALPPAAPDTRKSPTDTTGGGYRVRWLLSLRDSTQAVPGEFVDHVAVYPPADEARVLPPAPPSGPLNANAVITMDVNVVNQGSAKWAKGTMRVGYHWYYPDGVEYQWQPPVTTPVPGELEPGKSAKVSVNIRVPDRDGAYILSFDVVRTPDTYLATLPVTPSGDLGLIPVRVTGGRLAFVDLSTLYNLDAVATEDGAADGNFDGAGASLPAEFFPPDYYGIAAYFSVGKDGKLLKDAPAYPSGYFADISPSARLVSFRFGPKGPGAKNAVVCKGQKITLSGGQFASLHLAAAATGGADVPTTVVVRYKDGTEKKVAVTVGDWNKTPGESDPIAVRAFRKRTPTGDFPAFVAIRHIIVPLDIAKEIVSVTLPQEEKVKVFAMTLEK